MTDREDHDDGDKSRTNLKAIVGGGMVDEQPDKLSSLKANVVHNRIAVQMIDSAAGKGTLTRWPIFPERIHKWIDEQGEPLFFYENADKIVRRVSNDFIESCVAEYWLTAKHAARRENTLLPTLSADDCSKTRRLWGAMVRPRTEPFPLLTWKSDPRVAFHKMPFDPLPLAQCKAPVCKELMDRTTNAKAFMAWVGSIFDEKSQLQQYVWMYGTGGNGKGTFVRCLMAYLGSAAKADTAPQGKQPPTFWTSGLLGKRLCVFPDCDEPGFVSTGTFKSLTGEDQVRVEIKRGSIFSMQLPLKFLFTSNEKPLLSGADSDMRRIIYCSVTKPETPLERYEERMMAEMPAFLSACWHTYQATTKGNPRVVIQADDGGEELSVVVSEAEHDFQAFVDGWLAFDRDEHGMLLRNRDVPAKKHWVSCADMTAAMIKAGFPTESERRKLRRFLERKCGIKATKIRAGATTPWVFEWVEINRS